MSNKKIIWAVSFVVILLILILGFYFFKNSKQDSNEQRIMVDDVKSSVGDGVEKTNPFKADVNPYNGYTNPFAQ